MTQSAHLKDIPHGSLIRVWGDVRHVDIAWNYGTSPCKEIKFHNVIAVGNLWRANSSAHKTLVLDAKELRRSDGTLIEERDWFVADWRKGGQQKLLHIKWSRFKLITGKEALIYNI